MDRSLKTPVARAVGELAQHDWACLRTELIWLYDDPVEPKNRRTTSGSETGIKAWYIRKGHVRVEHQGGAGWARQGGRLDLSAPIALPP